MDLSHRSSEQNLTALVEKPLTEVEKRFSDRLTKAYGILPKMEEQVRLRNWETAMVQSREIVELYKKDVTSFIKEMVSETTHLEVIPLYS